MNNNCSLASTTAGEMQSDTLLLGRFYSLQNVQKRLIIFLQPSRFLFCYLEQMIRNHQRSETNSLFFFPTHFLISSLKVPLPVPQTLVFFKILSYVLFHSSISLKNSLIFMASFEIFFKKCKDVASLGIHCINQY